MNHAEVVTKHALEAVLDGARLKYRLAQSHGEYDFDVQYADGRRAALEATASVDRQQLEMLAATKAKTNGKTAFEAVRCRNSWIVFAGASARIAHLRNNLDAYLARLELAGIDRFSFTDSHIPCVTEVYRDLKVDYGLVVSTTKSPSLYISPSSEGELVRPDSAIRAGEREAWKDDNRRKLGSAGTNERHLAVYIDVSDASAWTALNWTDPPKTIPILPAEITDIWILAETGCPKEFAFWHGTSNQFWHSRRVCLWSTVTPE